MPRIYGGEKCALNTAPTSDVTTAASPYLFDPRTNILPPQKYRLAQIDKLVMCLVVSWQMTQLTWYYGVVAQLYRTKLLERVIDVFRYISL